MPSWVKWIQLAIKVQNAINNAKENIKKAAKEIKNANQKGGERIGKKYFSVIIGFCVALLVLLELFEFLFGWVGQVHDYAVREIEAGAVNAIYEWTGWEGEAYDIGVKQAADPLTGEVITWIIEHPMAQETVHLRDGWRYATRADFSIENPITGEVTTDTDDLMYWYDFDTYCMTAEHVNRLVWCFNQDGEAIMGLSDGNMYGMVGWEDFKDYINFLASLEFSARCMNTQMLYSYWYKEVANNEELVRAQYEGDKNAYESSHHMSTSITEILDKDIPEYMSFEDWLVMHPGIIKNEWRPNEIFEYLDNEADKENWYDTAETGKTPVPLKSDKMEWISEIDDPGWVRVRLSATGIDDMEGPFSKGLPYDTSEGPNTADQSFYNPLSETGVLNTRLIESEDDMKYINAYNGIPRYAMSWQTIMAFAEAGISHHYREWNQSAMSDEMWADDEWGGEGQKDYYLPKSKTPLKNSMEEYMCAWYPEEALKKGYLKPFADNDLIAPVTSQWNSVISVAEMLSYSYYFFYRGENGAAYDYTDMEDIFYTVDSNVIDMSEIPVDELNVGDTAYIRKIPAIAPYLVENMFDHIEYKWVPINGGGAKTVSEEECETFNETMLKQYLDHNTWEFGKAICVGREEYMNILPTEADEVGQGMYEYIRYLTNKQFDGRMDLFWEYLREMASLLPGNANAMNEIQLMEDVYNWQLEHITGYANGSYLYAKCYIKNGEIVDKTDALQNPWGDYNNAPRAGANAVEADGFKFSKYGDGKLILDVDMPTGNQKLVDRFITKAYEVRNKHLSYQWGGYNINKCFDCAGFVYYCINNSIYNTGRTLRARYLYGDVFGGNITTLIPESQAQRGDLVFFKNTCPDGARLPSGELLTHVGIYLGDGKMIHAGDPVGTITSIETKYWKSKIVGFARINKLIE